MRYFLLLFLLLQCSLHSYAQRPDGIITNGVLVLGIADTARIEGTDLGIIKFKDGMFTSNCSYNEVIARLIAEAKEKGSNVIKIIKHKPADLWSSCDRISVAVFKVAEPRIYEHEIMWTADRKLTPEDFKDEPDANEPLQTVAVSSCGFTMETNRVTLFKNPKYFVTCYFQCKKSWFRKTHRDNKDVLKHEQTHFDICELYARMLRRALIDAHLEVGNIHKANRIYENIYADYKKRQELYDAETVHGTNQVQQQKWNLLVAKELADLANYSN